MEFPRHVHKPEGRYVEVTNEGDYEKLKTLGWLDQPPAHVEQPVHVLLFEALKGEPEPDVLPSGNVSPSISELTAKDAEDVIATATAKELAAMRAEEAAGKNRKGVLALIDVREADLLED